MNVAMLDLAAEYRELKSEIDDAVTRVLSSGRFILGPEGERLESEIASFVGVSHAVGVASGTDALHLALRAAGIGPGDEVVTPAFTFFATAETITLAGATPAFADIDSATCNVDAQSVEAALTSRTRAVIVVHLYGQCAAIADIRALCQQRGILLIEDCAQAIGADWDGVPAGAWGSLGCFSFYPTKNLGACGDAGLVTTTDPVLADRLRMLRHHGSRVTYRHEEIGFNSRLDEIQAAILRVKLRHLDRFTAARRRVAAAYRERLTGLPLGLPAEHGRGKHVYHVFTIRVERRDAVREALAARGIASAVYYPLAVHRQPPYEPEFGRLDLPNAEAATREVLSLPIYPQLGEAQIDAVCAGLRAVL